MGTTARVRLAELMATMSMAAEAGTTGDVQELGLRTAILASRLGAELGLADDTVRDAFYLALLQYVGCTGDSDVAAEAMGDEVAFGRDHKGLDFGDLFVALPALLAYARRGKDAAGEIAAVLRMLLVMPKMAGMSRTHCEVGEALARRFDVGEAVRRGIGQVFERWNGTGQPNRLRGEAIELPARVVLVAETAVPRAWRTSRPRRARSCGSLRPT